MTILALQFLSIKRFPLDQTRDIIPKGVALINIKMIHRFEFCIMNVEFVLTGRIVKSIINSEANEHHLFDYFQLLNKTASVNCFSWS